MLFECNEFVQDPFRFMEVQICEETKTVQFCCFDHGGDHPTAPSVALNLSATAGLIAWLSENLKRIDA